MSSPNSPSALTFTTSLQLPAHASSLAFNDAEDTLAVGSDDGSVRLYNLPDTKVLKAIRGLESVSGIVFGSTESEALFVAAGHSIYQYSLESSKLILGPENAILCTDAREKTTDDDDATNNIAVDAERSRIAFTLDSGGVGILDVAAGTIKRMRPRHTSIAYLVAFIPGHPNELVSGGYDCVIHHYNAKEGTLMAKFQFPSTTPFAPGMSRSPPFVTSLAFSSTGTLAAGCADGRVWISRGENESSTTTGSSKRKKVKGKNKEPSVRWRGLDSVKDAECGRIVKVTDGLVPAICFNTPDELIVSPLSGEIRCLDLRLLQQPSETDTSEDQSTEHSWSSAHRWDMKLQTCAKVNAVAQSAGYMVVGGLDLSLRKGVVEIWKRSNGLSEEHSESDQSMEDL